MARFSKFFIVALVAGVLLCSFFVISSFSAPQKDEVNSKEVAASGATPGVSTKPAANPDKIPPLPGLDTIISLNNQPPQDTPAPTASDRISPAPSVSPTVGAKPAVNTNSGSSAKPTLQVVSAVIPGLNVPANLLPVPTTVAPTPVSSSGSELNNGAYSPPPPTLTGEATSSASPGATKAPEPTSLLPVSNNITGSTTPTASTTNTVQATLTSEATTSAPTATGTAATPATATATVLPTPTVVTGTWQTSARLMPAINQVSTVTRIEGTFGAAVNGTYRLDVTAPSRKRDGFYGFTPKDCNPSLIKS